MKYILCSFLFVVALFSCSDNKTNTQTPQTQSEHNSLLSEKNLPVQVFKFDVNEDYSLITSSGVIVQIPKGSIQSDKNPVELEIQEALTMKDIFIAGLQTRSDGAALSSGGMIYINGKAGYKVSIKQPLKVLVPTENYNPDMQQYEGVKDSNGNINWINPKPLRETRASKRITHGQQLFTANCASCHAVHKDLTGPALYNVQNRRPKKWLYDFTRNSAAMIAKSAGVGAQPAQPAPGVGHRIDWDQKSDSNSLNLLSADRDYYSLCIFNHWNKTAMTAFPKMSDKDLEDLYTYIKLESDKRPELAEKFKSNCCDSCEIYQKAMDREQQKLSKIYVEQNKLFSIQEKIELKKNVLVAQQKNAVIFKNTPTPEQANVQVVAAAVRPDLVSPELYTGNYYELDIQTFGWTNIDVLLNKVADIQKSTLWVKVPESQSFNLRIQLLIPSLKVSMAGGGTEGDMFALKTKDGIIDLPLGRICYIVMVSEKDDQLYFDMKTFTSTLNQTIELKMLVSDSAKINTALNGLNAEGLTSTIGKKAHVEEIRALDNKIEKIQTEIIKYDNIIDSVMKYISKLDILKPKNCGCDDQKTRSERAVGYPRAE